MDIEERSKMLSKYEHIFKTEKKYYNKRISSPIREFNLDTSSFFQKAYLKFKDILEDFKDKKILDVGCGSGNLSFYLAHRGASVIGIDLSKNLIDYCKNIAKNQSINIEFKEMNAQIPEFNDETFDIVVGFRALHHLPNIKLFYRECKRLLKKKGFIAFIEPLKKNPIVELNRKYFEPKRRTKYEHPLFISDVELAKNIFGNIQHYEYFLLSPLAKVFSRFIKNSVLFKNTYKFLNVIEMPLCKINFFKEYCWQTVFKCIKT